MQFRQLLLLAMGLVFFACGSGPQDAATEEPEEKLAPEQVVTDNTKTDALDAYEITVTDASKASPRKEMSGTIAGSKIKVNYGSPRVKGRKVFGELESWGEVWRAGADEATVVTLENDVMVEGKPLPAGSYSLFLVPMEAGNWTVIFNKEHQQWGAYEYKDTEDALRVEVSPVMTTESAEEMDFTIEDGQLRLHWDKTMVPIRITAA